MEEEIRTHRLDAPREIDVGARKRKTLIRKIPACRSDVDTRMRTTIQRWGNSLAVRIPKTLAQETAFDEGDEVDLRADDDRILLERPHPKHYRLSDLLAGITKTNRHDAIDSGDPVNREAW